MLNITNKADLDQIKKQKNLGKKIVLVGGCFDILHTGHIEFLSKAKDQGDFLIVALENDKKVNKLKGKGRPINSQVTRSTVLKSLPSVDLVMLLPDMNDNQNYETLVKLVEPDIIAMTKGNQVYEWEKEYMNTTGVKIVAVTPRIGNYSTTKIAENIKL